MVTAQINMNKKMLEMMVEELARRMYYKLVLMKAIPEIEAIKRGKLKAKKNEEIDKLFEELLR